ncbi:hypothetical protein TSUD_158950 [Trifolium subterraneum]|uniref:Reverse transcriptase domain-containing protein n=1 Tax=Trifolium subterraneum TaxID=3900 RepID=A0A2Z6N3L3_TRISU|nr:hypothetical protein TSUD_158950 [Trifolium subterraneum]
MENLNINDVEGTRHTNVDQTTLTPEELLECCLIGKLLVNKPIRFGDFQSRLAHLWQPGKGVEIRPMEDNKFMFQFFHPLDMERIYQGGPWLYENHMLILRKVKFGEDPIMVPMESTEIWVQVHHLPFGFMCAPIGWLVGNHIGKHSWVFERDEGEPVQVHFKYEKLGNFCFACGIIGHTQNSCNKRYETSLIESENRWGNYLKAENSITNGGATANRWLRGGRNSDRGGRGGAINAGVNAGIDHAAINANIRLHAIHGRIKVGRDSSTRKLIFFKLMEEKLEGINTGNYCWVKFDVFSGKLLNVNDEGNGNSTRGINEQRMTVHMGPQPTIGGPGSQLVTRKVNESTANNMLAAMATSSINMPINDPCYVGPTTNSVQLLLEGVSNSHTQEAIPKKRPRKDADMLEHDNVALLQASNMIDMQVDTEHTATGVAETQQLRRHVGNPQSVPQQVNWEKPSHGRYKCNIDASFSPMSNKVGIGMCIRDTNGCFVAARTEWMEPILDVDIGEAMGLLRALNWMNEIQLTNVDLEMDCKRVVDSLYSSRTYRSDLGDILSDCRTILTTSLVNSHVKFIRRQANEAAHRLARVATSLANFHNFIDLPTYQNGDYVILSRSKHGAEMESQKKKKKKGSPSTVPNLKYLARTYKPDAIILYETMTNANKIKELKYVLGFDFCFTVDREGRGGGVAIFWNNSLKCQIMNYSLNHIYIEVFDAIRGNWRITGFYGFPEGGRRRASWNFLRHLSQTSQLPWCIIGDFNDILSSDEKRERTDRPEWLIHGFREAVTDAGLIDIELTGYPFTWFKSLGTARAVEEKLDRALANMDWCNMFVDAKLECLTTTASDHYPLLLSWECKTDLTLFPKQFKFEQAWLLEPNFKQFVHQQWNSSEHQTVTQKLKNCADEMSKWSAENCHKTRKEIEKYRRKLELVRNHVDETNFHYYNEIRKKLDFLLVKDDLFWKQRAKTFWYRDGDLNTRFYHATASARKKKNLIGHLEDSQGNFCNSQEGMQVIAKDYFLNIFQQQRGERIKVLNAVNSSITQEDNNALTAPFTMAEFKEAIFSMEADKCLGPDGFNPGFYQHFWDLCGYEIFKAGCSWLECGSFPPKLNSTNIALIPKGEAQVTMKDCRPISLCNVLYKIVAKVLANRLKPVLTKCILDNQSAFVPGRYILDNAMAAIEIIHFMKSKTRGKKGEAALKLDISKVYDRMDWMFLKDMMLKMGFSQKWIDWIMLCVETVDYSVIVNGQKVGPIVPGRGLRQGDPLSPYLFIICAEGLSALIKHAEDRGELHGVKICRNAPIILHLLFADDCFLFFKATTTEATILKNILSVYESASGQAINLQKSEFYCSRNVPAEVREAIANQLGVTQVLGTADIYLKRAEK